MGYDLVDLMSVQEALYHFALKFGGDDLRALGYRRVDFEATKGRRTQPFNEKKCLLISQALCALKSIHRAAFDVIEAHYLQFLPLDLVATRLRLRTVRHTKTLLDAGIAYLARWLRNHAH